MQQRLQLVLLLAQFAVHLRARRVAALALVHRHHVRARRALDDFVVALSNRGALRRTTLVQQAGRLVQSGVGLAQQRQRARLVVSSQADAKLLLSLLETVQRVAG